MEWGETHPAIKLRRFFFKVELTIIWNGFLKISDSGCTPNRPIPSNSALLKGTAILSGVQNHTRCFQVHSFNPTMHRKNNQCTLNGLTLPIMHCESNAPNEFPHLSRRWRTQLNLPFIYFRSVRLQRNTTQVQINCKSFGNPLILLLELLFQMIIKQQAN